MGNSHSSADGRRRRRNMEDDNKHVISEGMGGVGHPIPSPPQRTYTEEIEQPAKPRTVLQASIRNRGIHEIPSELYAYSDLEILDLAENRLRVLPEEMRMFGSIKRLSIGSNCLTVIPEWFGEFKELTWLDFTHNDVHTISDGLGRCLKLTSLGASDCRLTEFPEVITRLRNLRKLGVFNNTIRSIPSSIGKLRLLTKLDLSGNALTTLPEEIGMLTELTWLNLSKNNLESLPAAIGRLGKLKEFGLAFNRLKKLPDLSGMRELELLPAYSNELEEIGEWIGQMGNLCKLDLSYNKLPSVPSNIFSPPRLTFINLSRNRLTRLPPFDDQNQFARSPCLTCIDVRENLLESIPISLMGPSVQEFKCAGNPFSGMPGYIQSDESLTDEPIRLMDIAVNAILKKKGDADANIQLQGLSVDYYGKAVCCARKCPNCSEPYIGPSSKFVVFVETTDCPVAPFVLEACTHDCVGRFRLLPGVHYPHPEIADPRTPRHRDPQYQ